MWEPLHDWLLVHLDPLETHEGPIVLLHGQVTRTATVLRTGPGRSLSTGVRVSVDVQPGDRVVFRREHLEHKPGKQVLEALQELGTDLGLIRAPDVLYAIEHESPYEQEGLRKEHLCRAWAKATGAPCGS